MGRIVISCYRPKPGQEERLRKAIDAAHTHPTVLKMWEEYGKVSEFTPVEVDA